MSSSRRNTLILALACAIGAYLSYRADNFWGLVILGLGVVWALIGALPIMDGAWRSKVGFVAAVFFGSLIVLWPTFEGMSHGAIKAPAYVKEHIDFGVVKGLDLQGGLRLVYTVEVEEAIRDKRDKFADQMRQELAVAYGIHTGEGLLKRDELQKLEEKVHVSAPESAMLRIKFKDPADVKYIDDRFAKKFSAELAQLKGGEGEVVFKIRSEIETQIRDKAVAQAKDTVNRRVDELGLREASVTTRDEDIIVEVPGQDERAFNEIKEIIRRTARLEFKMLDDEADFFGKIPESEVPASEGIEIRWENAPAGPGKNVKTYFARINKRENESMNETLERFKKWTSTLNVPDDHVIGFEKIEDMDEETGKFVEKGWRTFYLYSRAEVTGEYITDAQRAVNTQSGMPEVYVAITFSPAGADRFEEVTGANVQRRFAIILDDIVNSAPVIKTKIGGGHASITMGSGDPDTQLKNAEKLEMVLRSGALPAPITPSNESLIGPTLGEDAITKGALGAAAGAGLVLLFMLFYYRKSGVVADLAVLFNLLLQLAILASFSGTLTLPGIAGLALSIGIAVDANVLINERIREELRAGRTVRAAVEAGYDKAFSAIVDGHVTIFISGLILAQYGTGPVKGFAVTLIIGIVASLFTGVFCTRLVFDWWARGAKVKRLSVGAEF
ncbi:Protein-export membrane protein SecD [Labilithrix luteola]|uniref:Protein translocase subunit SecD n=1 Tax=Labilithrix luteola TaxID=1391654 RepID=A0A0K1Q3J2_9BACT|nr:protein translocase subunit SecD [Labilithrix luteola]AKU99939.1 Protein-export membrane protein SecD [Labilithrix luteola]